MDYIEPDDPVELNECSERFVVKDVRKNKQSLGNYGGLAINTEESTEEWLKNALSVHFRESLNVDVAGETSPSNQDWSINLKKSYVTTLAAKFSANVVLTVENKDKNFRKLFRGNSVTTNWAGKEHEMLESLNLALQNGLEKLEPEIRDICTL
ncbi:hypothetical protein FLL45_08690 [Aliikangiella marina]|uniref:Uncharacterized protein n=1 Tax=Aliikangiella marina TaxID=1712262 RepID=A0A545TCR2_9GAMM|nr:hypothetical protein [Aliikangiella marina]TQV75008.1 hypothetical protein FLL45_08690 [Aliikangiella marina]